MDVSQYSNRGRWAANEQSHIKFLELKAVSLNNRYYESWKGSGVKSGNTTATIAYLNNVEGTVS